MEAPMKTLVLALALLASTAHAAPASLVLDGGDVEQQQLTEPTRYTLCATGDGRVALCGDRQQLCWDVKHQRFDACTHVENEEAHGTLFRVSLIVGAQLWDILTTGVSVYNGGHEKNPLVPTPEIRLGAKGLFAIGEIGITEFAAHHGKRNFANGVAVASAVIFGVVGVHNLKVAWHW
jgi:hypothetical protein